MRSLEKEGAAIVMVGAFNPSIFQPRWLGSLELIRAEEAETATITTIQGQLADFQTDWFRVQVLQNRFSLQSLDATHYGPIRDLVSGMFKLLSHTPVSRMAMTRWFHYKMDSTEDWHEVGNKLAPKEFWHPLMDIPGLRSMMMQGRRTGAVDGVLYVKAEPSLIVNPGVFVEITEEFVKSPDDAAVDAQWVPGRLDRHFAVMKYSEDVAQGLLDAVLTK